MRDQDIIEQVAAQVLQELRKRPRGWQTASDPLEGFGTGPQASCSCGGSRTPVGPPTTTRRILAAGACRVSALYPKGPIQDEISACIDHTLLKPEATPEQVERLCLEAQENQFASVCVNPVYVALCAQLLQGSGVAVCTVVGFPLGSNTTDVKVFETRKAVDEGASEIDMVIHVGALKAGEFARVRDDIQSVNEACGHRAFLKVIIEAALLTDEEKIQASTLSKLAGAEFVKTSTGFGPGGATIHDVELMRRTVGEALGVKAAGGIRDRQTAEDMIRAGADRIGASASVKIIREGSTSTS